MPAVVVPCKGSAETRPNGATDAVMRRQIGLEVLEERCMEQITDRVVAVLIVALKDSEDGAIGSICTQPAGNVGHEQVRQQLIVLGAVLPPHGLEARLGGD